ncbi:unnamed protein product [Vitrella brassicaformis CCMP3155]|uniref:Dynein light chain Tctex-type 1 n=2 Tax=Vitrella brassicaformis TaxID=1169539 RepID=A0A0G4GHG5_VITBC|nr:unnamed protein product [Vitrella brassicaformis CCMP3155]|mmetsp:Transcript_6037/g.14489  ORF Transcript_6037/g.14489 Transcript_6037/m.14489 type:complete len:123 (+) Transcript_6037:140-508(+)|eukprot:CEM29170.1 unnamed protein product [Vitrella brassicaformis CCMP3155]
MADDSHSGEESAWSNDEIEKIVVDVLDSLLKNKEYQEEMVPYWIDEICETTTERLNELKKSFKYIVSCVLMQRNGAGLHTVTSCFWDTVNDGVFTYVWPKEKSKDQVKKSLYCILTVFGVEY